MSDAFERALASLRDGRAGNLAIIQNFRSSGGYNAIAFHEDAEAAVLAVINSGQRHPGFAMSVVHGNDAPPHPPAPEPSVMESFTLRVETPLVLVWAPALAAPSRCEVHWVGPTPNALSACRRIVRKLRVGAVAGQVLHVGCSEGQHAGYRQERRNAIGLGID